MSKIDTEKHVFTNCDPLSAFLVLKLSVKPTQWFKFDIPVLDAASFMGLGVLSVVFYPLMP